VAAAARPLTAVERILARTSGAASVRPGDIVVCAADRAVLLETLFMPNSLNWRDPLVVAAPERALVVFDHGVPAPSPAEAGAMVRARAFCEHFGIEAVDLGGHGISHQIVAERGLARPGELLLCSDSHTCASGAFNCAARGVGGLEMLQVVVTGGTWFVVQPTVRVELTGALAPRLEGKDAFLALAAAYGSADNRNLEFDGPGVAALSLHDRRTIATQCAEINAEFVLFPCDDAVRDHLAARGVHERGAGSGAAASGFSPAVADPGATYDDVWRLDLSAVVPQVATPGAVVGNVVAAADAGDVRLDQCFVGSCANGHLEDFAAAAELLRGRQVAAGTRLIVTPASQQVYLEAVRAGYVTDIVEAGGVVTPSTCGACFGYHMGVLGDGETCLTASTRNFKGRMGSPEANVWLGSTRTVVASAIAGRIVDPREVAAPTAAAATEVAP
jgi:3-isopropylmalate/(R)-2-methylmalate dehydratase large subunit